MKRNEQQAVVTIGFDSYLLPMSQAARVVEIISRGAIVVQDYSAARDVWHLKGEAIRASLKSVSFDQIKTSDAVATDHSRRANT